MERTNFYDTIYSPVVLLLNAVVVGIVMLLSPPAMRGFYLCSVCRSAPRLP